MGSWCGRGFTDRGRQGAQRHSRLAAADGGRAESGSSQGEPDTSTGSSIGSGALTRKAASGPGGGGGSGAGGGTVGNGSRTRRGSEFGVVGLSSAADIRSYWSPLIIMQRMAGPTGVSVRSPAVAGSFYPGAAAECRAAAVAMLNAGVTANRSIALGQRPNAHHLSGRNRSARGLDMQRGGGGSDDRGDRCGPAGCGCGGGVRGDSRAVGGRSGGAGHIRSLGRAGWRFTSGRRIAAESGVGAGSFASDDRFHQREHAVEVELPLLQIAWPGAKVLAVQTPPIEKAVDFGRGTARAVKAMGLRAVYLASSDMTHSGRNMDSVRGGREWRRWSEPRRTICT